ncbi:MAG: NAD(P)/FAD-dependent oxidoreductase [Spirochaetales bacterium]|nr:NAD(P)/FAD-dependent oxidoreductase [Spirochaetales bacterium]
MSENYDVIVSGAGPAGLSAGFFLASKGMKVLILEKNKVAGEFPRAETLRDNEVLDEVLGAGFMQSISLYESAKRVFNSPGAKKSFVVNRKRASYLFHWHKMIAQMEKRARGAGAQIMFEAEVAGPILEDGNCVGVQLADGREFYAKSVFACDGYSSKLGEASGVDYTPLNCPISKKVINGLTWEPDGLEFYFIAENSLEYAPNFPASIAFIFPRNGGEVEAGIMVLTGTFLANHDESELPDMSKSREVLDRLILDYPKFSDKLKGGKVLFEGESVLPMAGMFEDMCTIPGLVLCGDSIGFVEASGGCGVVSSMKSARFAAEFVARNKDHEWDLELLEEINLDFKDTDIYRKIRKTYRLVLPILNFFFAKMRTQKRINRYWKIIKIFYNLG